MKTLFPSLLLFLILASGCPANEVVVNPAPPLLGFGDLSGSVPVTGEITAVRVYWTRGELEDRTLEFELLGEGVAENVTVLTPSPLSVPAGTTEVDIELAVRPDFSPDLVDATAILQIREGNWYRLTERDTFSLSFSVPHTVELERWAPDEPFPQLWGYTSFNADPVPDGRGLSAGRHFAFAHVSTTLPNVIGMFNTQAGNSTNALNLHRIYADYDVSSASANVRIPQLFRLIPDTEGASSGRVEVIEQRVTVTRRSSSGLPPFTVGISGEGTYDETSGVISVAILFDESELGISDPVLRRYKYESKER